MTQNNQNAGYRRRRHAVSSATTRRASPMNDAGHLLLGDAALHEFIAYAEPTPHDTPLRR